MTLNMVMTIYFRIAAALCFFAVALGAFGAHALRETLEAHQSRQTWNTAVLYHFFHGLALVILSLHGTNRLVFYLFLAGIVLFSGSLYCLATTQASWLGPITPVGGLCFLAGWACLIFFSR
jgi:uncharacterized membrane protein YgdD (TMEM256/DUF423 family)